MSFWVSHHLSRPILIAGMTLRMGLALGLHVESSHFSPAERYRRRHVWWSMAWQDSHFSLSYDRPSTTAVSQPEIAKREGAKPGDFPYFESLCGVISLALKVVRSRMLSPHSQLSWENIQDYKDQIQKILIEARPYLRDPNYCMTTTEHLERTVLKLHSSYFSSELCRPALKATANTRDPQTARMRAECIEHLMTTVEAYVEMHAFSSHAARSWITLQRAISSIFLLAVTEDTKSNPHFWTLLRKLKAIISERANAEFDYGAGTGAAAPGPSTATTSTADASRSPLYNMLGQPIPNPAASPALSSPAAAAVAVETQTQWAKPLTKTLRALEKLEAAFHTRPSPIRPTATPGAGAGAGPSPYLNPATAAMAGNNTNAFVPVPSSTSSMGMQMGSVPPQPQSHTPESSTSGEWTFPTILDRAQEYIHPPLWS